MGPVPVQVPKVRDRSGSGVKFNSALLPPYVRRSARISATLPWLYLKGISTGDMSEALQVLVGEDAKGLSPNVVGRLKAQWAAEHGLTPKTHAQVPRHPVRCHACTQRGIVTGIGQAEFVAAQLASAIENTVSHPSLLLKTGGLISPRR